MVELIFLGLAALCLIGFLASSFGFSIDGMFASALVGFACLIVLAVKLIERAFS